MTTAPERVETLIIGGGQAGLAVGYHLARKARPFVIVDANQRIGDAWRNRWDALRLFTQARYSGLPGWPFPVPAWSYPTKDQAADYLEAYAEHFQLPVRTGIRIDTLAKDAERFVTMSGPRRIDADNVVIASGAYHSPRVPAFASDSRTGDLVCRLTCDDGANSDRPRSSEEGPCHGRPARAGTAERLGGCRHRAPGQNGGCEGWCPCR